MPGCAGTTRPHESMFDIGRALPALVDAGCEGQPLRTVALGAAGCVGPPAVGSGPWHAHHRFRLHVSGARPSRSRSAAAARRWLVSGQRYEPVQGHAPSPIRARRGRWSAQWWPPSIGHRAEGAGSYHCLGHPRGPAIAPEDCRDWQPRAEAAGADRAAAGGDGRDDRPACRVGQDRRGARPRPLGVRALNSRMPKPRKGRSP